jgi:outer membrane protein assembly factor BamD
MHLRVALALCLALIWSCSSAPSGTAVYATTAQQNYTKGLNELKGKDWVAAAKYFAFIRARFPYSRYAVLAELRIADAEFGAGHYLQAVDGYKLFIKFHPTHEMVTNGYAEFRIGEAYYKMVPDNMWILPPSYEKDQSATYDAERELRTFIKKHPSSPYTERAQKLLQDVHAYLAAHEWYVARFYWDKGKPMGTVLRLRRLLDRYSGTRYDVGALWLLGQAYMKVNMPERAKDVWQRLVDEHPDHPQTGAARRALAEISS